MVPIKLFYLRRSNGKINFGDELSPNLLEYVTKKQVVWAPIASCDVVGLGSILSKACTAKQFAHYAMRRLLQAKEKQIVWGSGFIKETGPEATRHLDFRLVRGPRTSGLLKRKGLPFGDPGLLAADIAPRSKRKKYSLGIIPHFVDAQSSVVTYLQNVVRHSTIISVEEEPISVLKKISECDFILSSSLHGLIVADSYNIPNLRMRLSDKIIGGDFKFLDYAESIGRKNIAAISLQSIFDGIQLDVLFEQEQTYMDNIHAAKIGIISSIKDL